MYNDTITLFNRVPNRVHGDRWYPTVIHGVDVNMDRAAIIKAMKQDTGDSVKLHVKYTKDADGMLIGGKRYALPKEYSKVAEPQNYITFKSGKNFDFFYVGEWANENPIDDEDYAGSNTPYDGFYDYMNSEYDNVFAITTVSGAYSVIPHFEILGK